MTMSTSGYVNKHTANQVKAKLSDLVQPETSKEQDA